MNHKRIIVDFDDTLAHTVNRDWKNAVPNTELIAKLNSMAADGWTIDIFTARGSISCATREEADKKYRADMEAWLKSHSVSYNLLSFDKPLGAYYIDDKGITPEEFIKTNIQQLKGGLSGSDLYSDGKFVHKTDKNCHKVNAWFNEVSGVINTPKITRVVGETMTMEFIQNDKNFFREYPYIALGLIQDTLSRLQTIEVKHSYDFDSYIRRIQDHVDASGREELNEVTTFLDDYVYLRPSFSHGDFGITNCLFTEGRLVMIDPIVDMFGAFELDCAKFIASLYINRYDKDLIYVSKRALLAYNGMYNSHFTYLVAAEIIRVYKYHPDKEFIMDCIKDVLKQS